MRSKKEIVRKIKRLIGIKYKMKFGIPSISTKEEKIIFGSDKFIEGLRWVLKDG